MTFELNVIINNELIAQLLSFGAGIRVLSPQSLATQLRDIHHQATSNYP